MRAKETLDRNARPLNELAMLCGWATPKVESGGYQYGADHEKILNLQGQVQVQLTAFGETPIGFLLGRNGWEIVPASGQLNAAHSRWLHGATARVGRLRGYGDGIVTEVAQAFIEAYLAIHD